MIQWQIGFGIFVIVLCVIYMVEYFRSHQNRTRKIEGFINPTESSEHLDETCYDLFYAKVYDDIVQPSARAAMEVQIPLDWMVQAGKPLGDIRVADIGCGTGLHAAIFKKAGVHSITGFDRSEHMISEAKRKHPEEGCEFRIGDATDATMTAADQYDLITMYYFTIYLVPERTAMLKNIYLWLAPGGVFCCHIVNKLKFDPILESASPFLGFSVQKYASERVTKSNVSFEEFEYTGDFQLHGSRGVYEEVFRFRDGRIRRHEQRVWMPTIEAIVSEIEAIGFTLKHHVDLMPIHYEYQYLFLFTK
jgi:ubiquinone/menaquinone biosynthesis C-methylase UbiE